MKVLSDITVPARGESLEGLKAAVMESARDWGLGQEGLFCVELVTEEAVVNIFNYAYPQGEGNIRLRCMDEGDRFVIEVIDWGVPFDVTTMPEPDVTGPLDRRPVGGLGIHFIRKMTDEVRYMREGGCNVLSLFLRKEGPANDAA